MSSLLRSGISANRRNLRTYSTNSVPEHGSGGLRGGLLGLLIGLGLAGSIANTYVIDQYKESQQKLLVTITQLQQSTEQFKGYARKIDEIGKAHAYLMANAATTAELEAMTKSQRKLHDTLYGELLELKAHVAELGKLLSR